MTRTSLFLAFLCIAIPAAEAVDSNAPGTPAAPQVIFPAQSPAATVKQRVGLTEIEISYSRPSAKGRAIFGALIPYGEVWRTGANRATRLTLSTAAKLNGTDMAAGTYEIFTIPGKSEWTLILHQDMSQWGAYTYDAKHDIARIKVQPIALTQHLETFAIGFSDLRDQSALLNLGWEKIRLPIKIEVDVTSVLVPQIEAAMKSPGTKTAGLYFNSATYYFEHGIDLGKALAWATEATTLNPKAAYMMLLKARLHAKLGDKVVAREAALKTVELGLAAEGPASGLAVQGRDLAAGL